MNLPEYYKNIRIEEAKLEKANPDGYVYIRSLKNSMKNSTEGAVHLAKMYNAARGIVDETHRVATQEEIDGYLKHQETNRVMAQRSEARKKKEIVVVMDRQGVSEEFPEGAREVVDAAIIQNRRGSRQASPATE